MWGEGPGCCHGGSAEGIDMCSSVVVEALVHLDASFKFSGYPVFFLVLLLHFISFNTASNMFA